MTWKSLRSKTRMLLLRHAVEDELRSELDFHIEMQTRKNLRLGMTSEEARRQARIKFGSGIKVEEECRDSIGFRCLNEIRQDVFYAIRILRKSSGFTLVAIISLALGIGVNTIVFSVINSLLLRPLPVRSPEQLYFIDHNGTHGDSFPNYKDVRDRNIVFSSLFMYRFAPMSVEAGGSAQRLWGYLVTGNYFEALGIHPVVGRFFTPDEDLQLNANPVAVLSYDFWKDQFALDPTIVGRVIRINTHPYTVLGVAPEGFRGMEFWYRSDIWLPLSMQSQIEGYAWTEGRNNFNGWVAGRIKPGVTLQQGNANLQAVAADLAREYRENDGMQLSLSPPGSAGKNSRSRLPCTEV